MPDTQLYILGAVIVIGLLCYVFIRQMEKKRTKALSRVALKIGYSFNPSGKSFATDGVSRFHLFKQGYGGKVTNVLSGNVGGTEAFLFDYRYTVGYGRHSRTYQQTVFAFRPEKATLPQFELRPETLFHKIGSPFGYKDIDFEGHPEFSKQYLLRGANESAIRSLFHPGVLNFFAKQKGWSIEGEGDWLLVYRHAKRMKPENLLSQFETGKNIFALFQSGAS